MIKEKNYWENSSLKNNERRVTMTSFNTDNQNSYRERSLEVLNANDIYHFLYQIKKDHSKYYEDVKSLLEFIYGSAYLAFPINDMFIINSTYNTFVTPPEPDLGIIAYLNEILNCQDERFPEQFFDKVPVFCDVLNSKMAFVEQSKKDNSQSISGYIVDIYCILACFHYHQDNFALFKSFIDEVLGVLPSLKNIATNFSKKKIILDSSIALYNPDLKILKDAIIAQLKKLDSNNYVADYVFKQAIEKIGDFSKIKSLYGDHINEQVYEEFISEMLDHHNHSSEDITNRIYSSSVLIIDDYYDYFNKKLDDQNVTPKMREWLIKKSEIGRINGLFFLEENKLFPEYGQHFFERIYDFVFDSDSFFEFAAKAEKLKTLSETILQEPENAREALNDFLTTTYHEHYGIDFSLPDSKTANLLPSTIEKRMAYILQHNGVVPKKRLGELLSEDGSIKNGAIAALEDDLYRNFCNNVKKIDVVKEKLLIITKKE